MKLLRQMNLPERLAVALGIGGAKVAADLVLGVRTLFDADHRNRNAIQTGNTRNHGGIIAESAVAVHLQKAFGQLFNVGKRRGPARAAGGLHAFIGLHFPASLRCSFSISASRPFSSRRSQIISTKPFSSTNSAL